MSDRIIGLDIGGSKCAVLVGTYQGEVLQRAQFPTESEQGFEHTWERLCEHVTGAWRTVRGEGNALAALSVSIGGPLDCERGIIYSPPNLPGWDAIPLKEKLQERFGVPAHVEHDGNAGALAEWRFGAGVGVQSLVFLTMGTGLGGGMILDGRLYRGARDMAGEVGHVRLAPDGPLAYGKRGSWEGLCAGPAFAALAEEMYPLRWGAGVDTREVVRLALTGDAQAVAVVERVAENMGRGLAMLVDLLNPEMIVIGSMAVRLGELLLEPTRRALRGEALPAAAEACQVVPAQLGERLGDVAALCAAIEAARD